jgi:8-oxo-dGTP pyrophosphatase MutT (NUDIX family)
MAGPAICAQAPAMVARSLMPVPEFVAALRAKVGHDALWLTTADAVIIENGRVLLVRHADRQEWMFPGGHVDPGEHPAAAAEREALEEAGVTIVAENLIAVTVSGVLTYANGDKAQHLEMAFASRIISGEAHVSDSESTDVRWFPLSRLPAVSDRVRAVVRHAASGSRELLRSA